MVMVQVVQANELSLYEVKEKFHLQKRYDSQFFPEWQEDLPELTGAAVLSLDRVKREFLAQLEYPMLEEAVKLVVLSPLLSIAGFYLPPFRVRPEASIQIALAENDQVVRGRIDVLVVQQRLWVLVVESKETGFSLVNAIPQALTYMMANPDHDRPSYGLCTNGSNFLFLKSQGQDFAESDEFSLRRQHNELVEVARILKRLGQVVG
jgi:hypothetical protein